MARPTKPSSSAPKRGRTPTKPATIDLDAKEVVKDKPSQTSTSATSEKPTFGRGAASKNSSSTKTQTTTSKTTTASGTKSTDTSAAKADTSTKTDSPKPTEGQTSKTSSPGTPPKAKSGSTSSLLSGLVGACVAVLGLGVIGQFDSASKIPLIGSIYSGQTSNPEANSEIELMNARIDELAAALNSSDAGESVDIAELTQKITALETSLAQGSTGTDDTRISQLETELENISSTLTNLNAEGTNSASTNGENEALTGISNRIEEVEKQIAGLSTPDLEPIQTSIEKLEGEVKALQEAISKNAGDIGAVTELAARLDNDIQSIRVSSKVAKSVAVNGLGSALLNDDALAIPISSLEALGGVTSETTRLGELSREGIPSIKELTQDLNQIADNIQNPKLVNESASITDKLWANARSLVTIRTSGPQEGDSAAAVLSRVKDNVQQGDLTVAQMEWKKLPPEVATSNAGWLAKLEKRMEAFAIYNKLSENLSDTAG